MLCFNIKFWSISFKSFVQRIHKSSHRKRINHPVWQGSSSQFYKWHKYRLALSTSCGSTKDDRFTSCQRFKCLDLMRVRIMVCDFFEDVRYHGFFCNPQIDSFAGYLISPLTPSTNSGRASPSPTRGEGVLRGPLPPGRGMVDQRLHDFPFAPSFDKLRAGLTLSPAGERDTVKIRVRFRCFFLSSLWRSFERNLRFPYSHIPFSCEATQLLLDILKTFLQEYRSGP